ncbi:hypothetical protein COLO4_38284 [Corchorus olitorius]|uniref:DUF4371 domain-containing protein n=1 Tax=Corchorus olitorius TaxID=93759 RepID=A0A1R3FVT3_9ROSI|nr:hypothetical protein COLO4_38284 [Corchorus olitorius]
MRGQGYDGASNMRGEWHGLQALFLNDCPFAYYVHCFAHRLQLALVAASKDEVHVHGFFDQLTSVVNFVGGSCKHQDELQAFQVAEIAHLVSIDELQTGKGANQIGTLQRAGDTRWGSHFHSICSLLRWYGPTRAVVENILKKGTSGAQRGEAHGILTILNSFNFVFILHAMEKMMGIIDILCQAFQKKSQDIVNVEHLVSTTKSLIQKLREE